MSDNITYFPGCGRVDKEEEARARDLAAMLSVVDELRQSVAAGEVISFMVVTNRTDDYACSACGPISLIEWLGMAEYLKDCFPYPEEIY